jgi:hypothetical protein
MRYDDHMSWCEWVPVNDGYLGVNLWHPAGNAASESSWRLNPQPNDDEQNITGIEGLLRPAGVQALLCLLPLYDPAA